MKRRIKGSDPIKEGVEIEYNSKMNAVEVSTGLTIEQYLMSHAQTPRMIFKHVAFKSRVRTNSGDYVIPEYGTPAYKTMVQEMVKADAFYRYRYAQAAIALLNEKNSQEEPGETKQD